VAEWGDVTQAALASELAGEIYGLDVLARHIEDHDTNTTRFLIMAQDPDMTRRADHMMTTFVFRVRNIPAALYKAMGGFATNGVNMTKLESYMVDGSFTATQFYADIEGHPEDAQRATGAGGAGVFHQLPEGSGNLPGGSRTGLRGPHSPQLTRWSCNVASRQAVKRSRLRLSDRRVGPSGSRFATMWR
jgi:hypothetical protein